MHILFSIEPSHCPLESWCDIVCQSQVSVTLLLCSRMATTPSGASLRSARSTSSDGKQDPHSEGIAKHCASSPAKSSPGDDTTELVSHTEHTSTIDYGIVSSPRNQMQTPESTPQAQVRSEDSFSTPAESTRGWDINSNSQSPRTPIQRPSTPDDVESPPRNRNNSIPVSQTFPGTEFRTLAGSLRERHRPQLHGRAYSADKSGTIPKIHRPQLHHRAASADQYGFRTSGLGPELQNISDAPELRNVKTGTPIYHYGHPFVNSAPSVSGLSFISEAAGPRYRPSLLSRQHSFDRHSIQTTSTKPYFSPWNPFMSPAISSHSPSISSHSSSLRKASKAYFRSHRIQKGKTDRPELRHRNPMEIWLNIIPVTGILIGLGIIGVMTWLGIRSVENHKYCSVLYDDFSHGFNPRVWSQDVQLGMYAQVL